MRAVVVAVLIACLARDARADEPAPVQVMIVGVYHMNNPGRDLHNMTADDVTKPARQAELVELSARLRRFRPTKVAVEAVVDAADLKHAAYRVFKPADLTKSRNETTQVGFRVARDMKLADVYGIDESSDTIDYFPYGNLQSYAARVGGAQAKILAEENLKVAAHVKELAAAQQRHSISELLAWLNEPARINTMHTFHYRVLGFGAGTTQPGADLNGAWYLRNAKIFAKLMQIARPGDRILVVFGAGHAFWLRHFATLTPGYQLVDANTYLTSAK